MRWRRASERTSRSERLGQREEEKAMTTEQRRVGLLPRAQIGAFLHEVGLEHLARRAHEWEAFGGSCHTVCVCCVFVSKVKSAFGTRLGKDRMVHCLVRTTRVATSKRASHLPTVIIGSAWEGAKLNLFPAITFAVSFSRLNKMPICTFYLGLFFSQFVKIHTYSVHQANKKPETESYPRHLP